MLQPADPNGNVGAWRLAQGVAVPFDAAPVPAGHAPVLLVPAEQVLVLAVDLPLATRAQRLAALPFALEDRVAGAAHLALGAAVGDRRYLAGAVAPALMEGWIAAAAAAGLPRAAIMPDALALPVPADGWAVARNDDRTLVRTTEGTGFACPADRFDALWRAGGQPVLTETALAWTPHAVLPLDLRQGAFAAARAPSPWRRLAWVAAAGVAAHGLIAAADVAALGGIAHRWRNEAASEVALRAPGANVGGDGLETAALALLPQEGGGAPSAFLPLLTRASGALPGVRLSRIAFDGSTLSLGVAPGLEARAMAALAAAGLAPRRANGLIRIGRP